MPIDDLLLLARARPRPIQVTVEIRVSESYASSWLPGDLLLHLSRGCLDSPSHPQEPRHRERAVLVRLRGLCLWLCVLPGSAGVCGVGVVAGSRYMAGSLEPWHQVLRADFEAWRQGSEDWEALKGFQLSEAAINRLLEMTSGEFRYTDEPAGLYSFHGVIQDMSSPEFYTAFYRDSSGLLCSHKFGSEGEGEAVDEQLQGRTPYRCLPVPGRLGLAPVLRTARVLMYEEGDLKIQTRVQGLGLWDGEAMHFLVHRAVEAGVHPAREEVLQALQQALGGDQLAAEYTFLSLLAFTEKQETQVGRLVLNLSQATSSLELASVLQQLSPTLVLPISLQFLNHSSLTPVKNYDTDQIDPSPLQVCDGTAVVLDETVLEAGALTAKGTANFQVLATLLTSQQLNYDFTYHPLAIPMRVPCITLSRTKSLFPFDVSLPIRPTQVSTLSQLPSSLHTFIQSLRTIVVDVSAEMQEEVSASFVQKRKEATVTVEDLHLWLNLSRLRAKSYGRSQLWKEDWDQALDWEQARKARLSGN